MNSKPVKYVVALDFEATCDENNPDFRNEIIEFPMLVLDWKTGEKVGATFHQYVRPVNNPVLTDFCKELTKISQETVDAAKTFPEVFKDALEFLEPFRDEDSQIIFVTFGGWDLRIMLTDQCIQSELSMGWIENAHYLNINKFTRKQIMKSEAHIKIPDMMKHLGIEMFGQLHSGIDDTTNILYAMQKYRENFKFICVENEKVYFANDDLSIAFIVDTVKPVDKPGQQ